MIPELEDGYRYVEIGEIIRSTDRSGWDSKGTWEDIRDSMWNTELILDDYGLVCRKKSPDPENGFSYPEEGDLIAKDDEIQFRKDGAWLKSYDRIIGLPITHNIVGKVRRPLP